MAAVIGGLLPLALRAWRLARHGAAVTAGVLLVFGILLVGDGTLALR